MRCLECCLDFHVQCDSDHRLLPTVWGQEHEHPLIYSTETIANKDDSDLHYRNIYGKELRKSEDPFYHCAICYEYVAYVRCAITEVQYDGKGKLRHLSHEHILALREISKNDGTLCYGCGKAVQGSTYCCDSCQFYLHKSCVELPRRIWGHQSHKQYLTLQRFDISAKNVCRTCKKRFSSGFIYHCCLGEILFGINTQYNMCLDCASTHPLIKKDYHEDQQRIAHFSHEHYLVNLEAAEVNCKLCLKNINGQCHGSAQCEFYIHNSCASLLQGIRHPFHPRHSLTLLAIKKPRYVCNACGFHYKGHQHPLILVQNMSYSFQCEACGCEMQGAFLQRCVECDLYFHVQCGSLPPPTSTEVQDNEREKIKHFSHKHLLFLLENKRNDKLICVACEKNIQANHPAYGCHHCEFYLHKSCVELPREIQHPLHRHPLSLPNPYSEEYHECDACHKHYYGFSYSCQDYLDCVFSEIIQFLEGKRKAVELRIVSKKINKNVKGLTYSGMQKSLTEEEKKMLESLIEVEKMTKEGTLRDVFDELEGTNHLVNKRITKELFAEDFLENTAREFVQGTLQLQYLGEDADAELVNVGDYKINLKFSPILRNLLKNHEGIFSSCSLTQSLKTIVLTTLCGVMQEMRDNKLRDINSDVFVAWWFPFKLVYKAGFRIDFALDHIKRIGDEHYLIQDASSIRTAPFTRFTRRSLIFRKRLINGRQGLKI
ncbi:phorbol-ester/DAG-type domain-containing protein [Citrus sinensis]|uniref:Phorbol-ester/DAG-type domain-containing protein n=1 Tax=Citrus sinensis TaxID=2711 RepID=A0ACB8JMH4_CITSI|nr:phorbol-ester/DAG-type domain-containing protein [Citrus sinensis]